MTTVEPLHDVIARHQHPILLDQVADVVADMPGTQEGADGEFPGLQAVVLGEDAVAAEGQVLVAVVVDGIANQLRAGRLRDRFGGGRVIAMGMCDQYPA